MFVRRSRCLLGSLVIFCAVPGWTGDVASFVDLGFSPDSGIYMFGQYGIQSGTLRPWAELHVVDVPKNDYVAGGRVSYTHDSPAISGQDGSGALYRLISQHTALAERHRVTYLLQGKPLYISVGDQDGISGKTIEFRDFERNFSYRATLVSSTEGSGAGLKSSFQINLARDTKDGSTKSYAVGNPQIKRSLIAAYRICKVLVDPRNRGLIFVIEMKKAAATGFDFRYMVETAPF